MPQTLPTDLTKASTYELVMALSDMIYDKAISSDFADIWEPLRHIVDELEDRVVSGTFEVENILDA